MHPIAYLIEMLLSAYNFALIAWVILGWLISMRVINRNSELVYRVFSALSRISFPAISFIRKYVPSVSGIDLSPLILFVAINFFRYVLRYYFG